MTEKTRPNGIPQHEPLPILVVEDIAPHFQMLADMLAHAAPDEYRLTHAKTLGEAISLLQREGFALVLLDLSLPDSEGFPTFAKILSVAGHTPIIILSGIDDEELAVETVKVGAQDYIVKSHLSHHWLRRSIRYALERARTDVELRTARADLERRVLERTAALREANEKLHKEIAGRERVEDALRHCNEQLTEALEKLGHRHLGDTFADDPNGKKEPDKKSARLLVAEDDSLVRDVLNIYLAEDQHDVVFAESAEEALEKFRTQDFDLVLTDRVMDGMDGEELAREVKLLNPAMKVILLTGYGEQMMAEGMIPEGIDRLVSKPFTIETLRTAIQQMLPH